MSHDEWTEVGQKYSDDGECPYGEVTNYHVLKRYHDNYAVRQTQSVTPGQNMCEDPDEYWGNWNSRAKHEWDAREFNGPDMVDREPSFQECDRGSFNVALSAAGPTISWTYGQTDGMCVADNSDTSQDLARIDWDYTGRDARTQSHTNDVGSELYTKGVDDCAYYGIVYVESRAQFSNRCSFNNCNESGWYGTRDWWTNWHCP
jgi:hypothetical protein